MPPPWKAAETAVVRQVLRLPPRDALQAAGLVLVLIVGALVVLGLFVDVDAVLITSLGVVSGAPLALVRTGPTLRVGYGGLLGVAGAAGVLVTDHPLAAVGVVTVLGLAQAIFHVTATGTAVMLPAVVAVCASVPLSDDPRVAAAYVVFGFVLMLVVARVLGVGAAPEPVERTLAVRHAAVSAVATAGVVFLVLRLDIGHGYWAVIAIAQVLQPRANETGGAARARVIGTLLGAGVAVAAVSLLPALVLVVMAVACLGLVVAWAFVGDLTRQAGYSTAALVVLGSSGLAGAGVEVAVSRLILFGGGAALAVVLSELLLRADRR